MQFLKDPRGTNVASPFAPINNFGLGLAIRTDVDTLYGVAACGSREILRCLAGLEGKLPDRAVASSSAPTT